MNDRETTPADVSDLESLRQVQHNIGYRFREVDRLRQALTHTSAIEVQGPRTSERLEFLGDAVVGLVLSELLLNTYPDHDEGRLSRFRAALVNASSFAEMAIYLELDEHVRLGRGEEKSGGRRKESILAAAFEAVMGAVFLDGGYEAVRHVVGDLFEGLVLSVADRETIDAKTQLQELCQQICRQAPVYRVVEEAGPDHEREFVVEALLGDTVLAVGRGRSKRIAEQTAALDALRNRRDLIGAYAARS